MEQRRCPGLCYCRSVFLIPSADRRRASPQLRDEFLNALEANDRPGLRAAATVLQRCVNPLPSVVCAQLGLQPGSTYGDGAAIVIVRLDGTDARVLFDSAHIAPADLGA